MTGPAILSNDDRTLTVRVPFALRQRGGRKLVMGPEGTVWQPHHQQIDSALIKALARAFRWRKLLESSVYNAVTDIAASENINASYVSRILRLTLLAPDIVEDILDGRQSSGLQIDKLLKPLPVEWRQQRLLVGMPV